MHWSHFDIAIATKMYLNYLCWVNFSFLDNFCIWNIKRFQRNVNPEVSNKETLINLSNTIPVRI